MRNFFILVHTVECVHARTAVQYSPYPHPVSTPTPSSRACGQPVQEVLRDEEVLRRGADGLEALRLAAEDLLEVLRPGSGAQASDSFGVKDNASGSSFRFPKRREFWRARMHSKK